MRIVSAILAFVLACAGVATASATATAADAEVTRLAVVYPLTVPPQSTGLVSAEDLEQYTSPTGVLTRKLDAVSGQQVTIGIDPMIIASIRILGNTAPASAIAWLAHLAAVPNETFALSYADSDIAALRQAGSTEILAPSSFQIDPERYPVETPGDENETDGTNGTQPDASTPAGEPATPTPTPTPEEEVPTSETLTDWSYSIDSLLWPRMNTVVADDLAAFNAAGPATTLLSSGNVAGTSRTSANIDGHSVLVADQSLSALLTDAVNAPRLEQWQEAVDPLLGALGNMRGTTILTVDRALPDAATRLSETLAAIGTVDGVTRTNLAEIMAEPHTGTRLVDSPVDSDRISRIRLMLAAEALVLPFSTVLDDPAPLTGERRLSLLALASNSWVDPTTTWTSAVDDWLTRSNEIVSSVQIAESSTLNFFQDRGNLPIAVSNALDHAITVNVTLRSATGILVVTDSRVPISIEPGSQARANIPVQSIANGEATLRVTLTSATGVAIGAPKTVTANVVAGWENMATLIIAVLLIVMFVAGIARTVVKSRRSRRSLTDDAGDRAAADAGVKERGSGE